MQGHGAGIHRLPPALDVGRRHQRQVLHIQLRGVEHHRRVRHVEGRRVRPRRLLGRQRRLAHLAGAVLNGALQGRGLRLQPGGLAAQGSGLLQQLPGPLQVGLRRRPPLRVLPVEQQGVHQLRPGLSVRAGCQRAAHIPAAEEGAGRSSAVRRRRAGVAHHVQGGQQGVHPALTGLLLRHARILLLRNQRRLLPHPAALIQHRGSGGVEQQQHPVSAVLTVRRLTVIVPAPQGHALGGGVRHLSALDTAAGQTAGQQLHPVLSLALGLEEADGFHAGLRPLLLEPAPGGQAQGGAGYRKSAGGAVRLLLELSLSQGGPEILQAQLRQPRQIQGPAGDPALIEDLSRLAVDPAEALRLDAAPLALVVEDAVFQPLHRALRRALGKSRVEPLAAGEVQPALAAVHSLGEAALIDAAALAAVGRALALADAVRELPPVGDLPVGVVAGPLAGGRVRLELALIGQLPALIELALAGAEALRVAAGVDQHAVNVGRPGPVPQSGAESALVAQQARLVIFLPLPLQQALCQPAGAEGDGLLFVPVHDHPARPVLHPPVLRIEAGGEKMAEDKGPDDEIDRHRQCHQANRQAHQQGFGDKQAAGLDIVLPPGGLLRQGGRPLQGGRGDLGGVAGEIEQPPHTGGQSHQPAGKEGPDRPEEYAEGPDQLCEYMLEQG